MKGVFSWIFFGTSNLRYIYLHHTHIQESKELCLYAKLGEEMPK